MLWHVPRVPVDQIYMPNDIVDIKRCAYYLKYGDKIEQIAQALNVYCSRKEFCKFFDETARSFIAPEWLYSVRDFVDEKLHKLYPKHRFVKGEIETSTMILLVQQSRTLFSPIDVCYPCLTCFPGGVEIFEVYLYAHTVPGDLNEETKDKYKTLLREGMDILTLSDILAGEIWDSVFSKDCRKGLYENMIRYSPELRLHIQRDALYIILALNIENQKEARR